MQEKIKKIEQALLELEEPSIYLNHLLECPWFQKEPWNILYQLSKTEQSTIHHPEGNVWNHTMLVVNEAAKVKEKSENQRVFMWAAFLHDIGKPKTTRNRKGKITAYKHDIVGAPLVRQFLEQFYTDDEFIESVVRLVRWHMEVMYVNRKLTFGNINQMRKEVNSREIALLGWCDRMGRTNSDPEKVREEITNFYHVVTRKKMNGVVL